MSDKCVCSQLLSFECTLQYCIFFQRVLGDERGPETQPLGSNIQRWHRRWWGAATSINIRLWQVCPLSRTCSSLYLRLPGNQKVLERQAIEFRNTHFIMSNVFVLNCYLLSALYNTVSCSSRCSMMREDQRPKHLGGRYKATVATEGGGQLQHPSPYWHLWKVCPQSRTRSSLHLTLPGNQKILER